MVSERRQLPRKEFPSGEDTNWRLHVDERLDGVDETLAENTRITQGLNAKLDDHREQTRPAIEAIQTMQSGVRAIGAVGTGIAWTGRTFWRVLRVTAPVAAALAAVWVALHEHLYPVVQGLMWWKK